MSNTCIFRVISFQVTDACSEILKASISGLSSLSPRFVETVRRSGRFANIAWEHGKQVEVTTLDALIATYGEPDYVKIDVEGFELEVIKGLSRPLPVISLEWSGEATDNILSCFDRLESLAACEFNLTWGESMKWARSQWMDRTTIEQMLNFFREDSYLWADIFIRSDRC